MNKEYSKMFSELSGHSGSKEYEGMAHLLFSFAGWTYEKKDGPTVHRPYRNGHS